MKKLWLSLIFLCLLGARLSAQQQYHLPQIANGGNFRTTFVVSNTSMSERATGRLQLTDDNGDPLAVRMRGGESNYQFPLALDPGQSMVLETDGSGPLAAGAADITSDKPVGVVAIFSQFDPQGQLVTEASVESAAPRDQFSLYVDTSGSFGTGLAVFNPAATAATLTLRLFDLSGRCRGTQRLTLPPRGHRSAFTSQLFPDVTDFSRGTLSVVASAPVAAVALRISTTASPTMTTLPTINGAVTRCGEEPLACVNIAGRWQVSEEVSLTCTMLGETITEDFSGTEIATIQDLGGCTFRYEVRDDTGQVIGVRTIAVQGHDVTISGAAGVAPEPGVVITEDRFTATGTVRGNRMSIRGSGSLRGTFQGIAFSCTTTTMAEFSR